MEKIISNLGKLKITQKPPSKGKITYTRRESTIVWLPWASPAPTVPHLSSLQRATAALQTEKATLAGHRLCTCVVPTLLPSSLPIWKTRLCHTSLPRKRDASLESEMRLTAWNLGFAKGGPQFWLKNFQQPTQKGVKSSDHIKQIQRVTDIRPEIYFSSHYEKGNWQLSEQPPNYIVLGNPKENFTDLFLIVLLNKGKQPQPKR